ncbi:MAG: hypothetical protein M0P72_11680 [Metallibacterium scheffleri]|jgi:hypothetical protein|uniref:hypothetical protein n=1 Tax=Metallibacterium scheffleri TaxID=993689 RepID=UPI0026F1D268|nr:hypothetical protein [Metallibacterium scheffleri]MCK9367793.1 hypothetical protein [Metallibacterium scheffleri]
MHWICAGDSEAERIRAHALICFLALALYRVMRMRLNVGARPELTHFDASLPPGPAVRLAETGQISCSPLAPSSTRAYADADLSHAPGLR